MSHSATFLTLFSVWSPSWRRLSYRDKHKRVGCGPWFAGLRDPPDGRAAIASQPHLERGNQRLRFESR
jgi:hypothetical protein